MPAPIRTIAALALVAGVLAGVPSTLAGEARASGNTPFRDGPGERFEVLGRLIDGQRYEVEDCTRESRWCLVSDNGEELGWVRGSYLVGSGAKLEVTPPEFLGGPMVNGFPFPFRD